MNLEHRAVIVKDQESAEELVKFLDAGFVLMSVTSAGKEWLAIIGKTKTTANPSPFQP